MLVGVVTLLAPMRTVAQSVPNKHIPPSVLLEVRNLESEFRSALTSDCAPDRCYTKGCVYEDHLTLDQPRTTSLPGLPAEESVGSVAPQEYLTRARCGFGHEKSVLTADVRKLARRLEKRLSHGWLRVAVTPEALEPIPKSLSESLPEEPQEQPPAPEVNPVPVDFTAELARRQLWDALLPHTPWMVAIGLVTFAVLLLIWAGRRLGAASLEDRMLEAQLAAGQTEEPAAPTESEAVPEHDQKPALDALEDDAFAEEQQQLWTERIERIAQDNDDVIARLLREWLNSGDYPTLARALLVFGDRVSQAFESTPELALKKVEFAAYLRDVDEAALPTRARFFRHLNQQAMATLLLSQEDVKLHRTLREDFGSSGCVSLMRDIPGRYSALLFALIPREQQNDVAQLMPADMRALVAAHLLSSTRISLNESAFLLTCVEAARDGQPLPEAPSAGAVRDFGPTVESAGSLSVLLPHIDGQVRNELFTSAIKRHGGSAPQWYEDIVFGDMLTRLPDDMRNDLLLEVDVRGLSAWLQQQPQVWRREFVRSLSGPLLSALTQTTTAASSVHQARWARLGHTALVKAFKSTYVQRGVRFVDLVS